MPQINDTTGSQKTSTIVRINAKAESYERVSIPRGNVDVIEGGLMKRDAAGNAALIAPAALDVINDTFAFINFSNPAAGSVRDSQTINDVGGIQFSASVESGGYAAVMGDGLMIGLPLTERFFVKADLAALATPGVRIVLKRETDPAAQRTGEVKFGAASGVAGILLAAATANEGALCFATSQYVDGGNNGVFWFLFGNRGIKN